jgi:hypothetical protein
MQPLVALRVWLAIWRDELLNDIHASCADIAYVCDCRISLSDRKGGLQQESRRAIALLDEGTPGYNFNYFVSGFCVDAGRVSGDLIGVTSPFVLTSQRRNPFSTEGHRRS